MKIKQFQHEYSGYDGVTSKCRMTFYQAETGAIIVIVDELPINAGTPVGEFSQHLATQAYRQLFSINSSHVDAFIFIEHSPSSLNETEYSYTRVEFDWDDEGSQFIHPERIPMSEEEVRALIGEEM
jgi:hypothetical protein